MAIQLLAASDELEVLVRDPVDGKIYKRESDGEQSLALDPAQIGIVGESPANFDYDAFARGTARWGMWRVFGADGQPYPLYDGKTLPPLKFTVAASGEPFYLAGA